VGRIVEDDGGSDGDVYIKRWDEINSTGFSSLLWIGRSSAIRELVCSR